MPFIVFEVTLPLRFEKIWIKKPKSLKFSGFCKIAIIHNAKLKAEVEQYNDNQSNLYIKLEVNWAILKVNLHIFRGEELLVQCDSEFDILLEGQLIMAPNSADSFLGLQSRNECSIQKARQIQRDRRASRLGYVHNRYRGKDIWGYWAGRTEGNVYKVKRGFIMMQ